MAEDNQFTLRIIAPDRVFYEGTVDMVEFCTTEGEIGVLPGHIPLTVIISPGILNIHESEKNREAALHAGFAQILPDEVTILAEIIEWPDEIDAPRASAARQRAEERIKNGQNIDYARAEAALMRAITRINVTGIK